MFSSQPPQESDTVMLTDTTGRTLVCSIEHSLEVDDEEYLLLMPIDSPVEIVAWDEEEEAEATLVEDEEEIDQIFSTAQAVLAEQNLNLKRTAFALTVAGELPEAEEEDILTMEIEEDDMDGVQTEQFQLLASFYYEEQEYAIYTPLEPLLFFAKLNDAGAPELLSPEEFKKVQPLLEEQLFDELE